MSTRLRDVSSDSTATDRGLAVCPAAVAATDAPASRIRRSPTDSAFTCDRSFASDEYHDSSDESGEPPCPPTGTCGDRRIVVAREADLVAE